MISHLQRKNIDMLQDTCTRTEFKFEF